MILGPNQLEKLVQGVVSSPLVILKCPKARELVFQWMIKKITSLVIKHFPSTFSGGETSAQSIIFKDLEAE